MGYTALIENPKIILVRDNVQVYRNMREYIFEVNPERLSL